MVDELIIYADESDEAGRFYGNFYGGAAVWGRDLAGVTSRLAGAKARLSVGAELKWNKVSKAYASRYIEFIDEVFDLASESKIRFRIMFTQNRFMPVGLTDYHRNNEFHILYYEFLKYSFGLQFSSETPFNVKLLLDQLPHTGAKNEVFKSYIAGLSTYHQFRTSGVYLAPELIGEIVSHNHVILQALDIILGAIQFRLNDKHLVKPAGATRRGAKTIAKETVYKHINRRIRDLYPGFNIGMSTGIDGDISNRWRHPDRHWLFVPSDAQIDESRGKRR